MGPRHIPNLDQCHGIQHHQMRWREAGSVAGSAQGQAPGAEPLLGPVGWSWGVQEPGFLWPCQEWPSGHLGAQAPRGASRWRQWMAPGLSQPLRGRA